MTNTIYFCSNNDFDIEHAFTFGVSAKLDDTAIGYFGTGLKFAVSTLLRTGHKVRVCADGSPWGFFLNKKEYRGKEFDHVELVDSEGHRRALGFTTMLGRNWEVWMAYRELASNSKDESGIVTDDPAIAGKYRVAIEVAGSKIVMAHNLRHEIFCDAPVIDSNSNIEVRDKSTIYKYYKTVRVGQLEHPARYTYNLKRSMDLTEDRTLTYQNLFAYYAAQDIALLTNEEMLTRILLAPKQSFEGELNYESASHPSETFLKVVGRLNAMPELNKSARELGRKYGFIHTVPIELNRIQEQQLAASKQFLRDIGVTVDDFEVRVVDLHGSLGQAKDGVIFISPSAFRMGTKYVAGTLYEEWLHLKEGCDDCTRNMQNILIDTIMSMGERLRGAPI